jgi:hypothetical protein
MLTPFSGLSLFIHLAIIGSAKLLNLLRGERQLFLGSAASRARGPRWYSVIASIVIIVFVSTVMISFTGIALTTGMREGAAEPHIQYLHSAWADIIKSEPYHYTRIDIEPRISTAEAVERRQAAETVIATYNLRN